MRTFLIVCALSMWMCLSGLFVVNSPQESIRDEYRAPAHACAQPSAVRYRVWNLR